MDASDPGAALVPQPPDAAETGRRQQLEDLHEELLLTILELEDEWLLDDRIAFALRRRDAA